MKLKYSMQFAMLLATSIITGSAVAQYVWLDAHGVKQFSDVAPPSDVPQNRILKQPHRSGDSPAAGATPDAAAGAGTADAAADAKGPATVAEKNAEYNKRKQEQAEKAKKASEEAKNKAAKADNCTRATNYLTGLKSGVRMATTDANGERSFMSDDERAKAEARTQSTIDSDCQ